MLQLSHGADPFSKTQEGQTPLDLASAVDVRCLLQAAMTSLPSGSPDLTKSPEMLVSSYSDTGTVLLPSGSKMKLPNPVKLPHGVTLAEGQSNESALEESVNDVTNIAEFLSRYVFR